MSLEPIASTALAPASPGTPPPYAVVSTEVTPVMPPGYTQTQTTKADGVVTTVVTNASGGMVDTVISTSTIDASGAEVSVWA